MRGYWVAMYASRQITLAQNLAWSRTCSFGLGIPVPSGISLTQANGVHTSLQVMAANGDWCELSSYVLVIPDLGQNNKPYLTLVEEIIQGAGSGAEL